MEEEKTEETNEKKILNKKRLIIIISVGVFAIVSLIVALYFYHKEPEPEEDKYANVIQDSVSIEKLLKIVDSAMFNEYGYEGLAYDFAKGVNGITDDQKITLAYHYLTKVQYSIEKLTEEDIPEKYQDDPYLSNPDVIKYKLSSRTFEKEYEKMFGKAPEYNEEKLLGINTCPRIYKYDSRTKKIFLLGDCELNGDSALFTKTYSYRFDDDYYYVYQYVALVKKDEEGNEKYYRLKDGTEVEVEDFAKNESLFETVIWKFDKNYNFISTTNQ